jgi:hypothetical protein
MDKQVEEHIISLKGKIDLHKVMMRKEVSCTAVIAVSPVKDLVVLRKLKKGGNQ